MRKGCRKPWPDRKPAIRGGRARRRHCLWRRGNIRCGLDCWRREISRRGRGKRRWRHRTRRSANRRLARRRAARSRPLGFAHGRGCRFGGFGLRWRFGGRRSGGWLLVARPGRGPRQAEILQLARAHRVGRRCVGCRRRLGHILGKRRRGEKPGRQQYRLQAQNRPHRSTVSRDTPLRCGDGAIGPCPPLARDSSTAWMNRAGTPAYRASTSTNSPSSSAAISTRLSPVMATPSRGPAATPFTRTLPLGTR